MTKNENNTFAPRLRSLRKQRKLTQKALGEKCGVAAMTIRQYEAGTRMPRKRVVEALAEYFGMSAKELLTGEKDFEDTQNKSKGGLFHMSKYGHKQSHFFAYIGRMRNIIRWALMRNTYQENVQEHSHMVAVLAHALAVIHNECVDWQRLGDQPKVDANAIAVAALYHDATEILTGDMPTPIKYYNPDIKNAYKKVEKVAGEKLVGMLPEELQATFLPIINIEDEYTHKIVKAADKLSAYIKCVEEMKTANNEFRLAAEQTYKSLEAMCAELPELAYFMEHCLDSFSLTLDEAAF